MADRRETSNGLLRVGRLMLASAACLALVLPALLGVLVKLRLGAGPETLSWAEGVETVAALTVLYAAGIATLAHLAWRGLRRATDESARQRILCTAAGALSCALLLSLPTLIETLEDGGSRMALSFFPFLYAVVQLVGAALGAAVGWLIWRLNDWREPGKEA